MSLTFEEHVSEELDTLFAGAVFLCGGDRERAETLVVDTVRTASTEFPGRARESSVSRWLEGLLAGTAWSTGGGDVDEVTPPRSAPDLAGDIDARTLEGMVWEDMVRAAAEIPQGPRVALWLVLLRRWPYDAAEEMMGIGRGTLRELLSYRSDFLQGLLTNASDEIGRETGS